MKSDSPGLPAASGRWAAFRRRHLPDYGPAAADLWRAIALGGALALLWALAALARLPLPALAPVALGLGLVALAAAAPVRLPPGNHSITASDLLTYLLLALHGPAAALLAAALDGAVGAWRTSKRLSSHLGSPAIGALAMAAAGLTHGAAMALLPRLGLAPAATALAALALAAAVHSACSTGLMMKLLHLKQGLPLGWQAWLAEARWIAALQLAYALLAGLLALLAQRHGLATLLPVAVVMAAVAVLLRGHMRHRHRAQAEQDARVAAAEAASQRSQRRFTSAFAQAAVGMALVDTDDRVLLANPALQQLLGRPENALLNQPFAQLLHPADAPLLVAPLAALRSGQSAGFVLELRCLPAPSATPGAGSAGPERWVSLHGARFDDLLPAESPSTGAGGPGGLPQSPNASPNASGFIFQLVDIGARRHAEQQLRQIAYTDALTGLDNRHAHAERLQAAVARRRRDPAFGFALMVLDLDRFKTVNDSLGHRGGDALLQLVAQRLRSRLRPGDGVARVGGDEFAVLLPGATAAEATDLAQQLLQALAAPARVMGVELRPQASIGLALADEHSGETDPDTLLRDADLAMYRAKAEGKGRLVVFDTGLRAAIGDKLQLETELRQAIASGGLHLVYQPLYALQPLQLCGFEALARWQHPQRGAISPAVFVALAEETGCIHALTAWAVDEAVRQHAAWVGAPAHSGTGPDARALVMHVNVSAGDLASPGFVAGVVAALQRHGLPARQLLLEVTESTLMADRDQALGTLRALVQHGVRVGIDDFGTGYSSLAYLSTLPFDCLKIDRSFIQGLEHRAENTEIVRAVISLGRALNKQVLAEGIETAAQLERLRALGATQGQGYLLARPLPASEAQALLAAGEDGAGAAA